MSLDIGSGQVAIVIDGQQIMEEKVHQEDMEEDENRPLHFNITIGYILDKWGYGTLKKMPVSFQT